MKIRQIIPQKSSEKVAEFLTKNALHKRDFAEMIGVTLSYVYNLIDETVPFSTRGTTIERIATVMDVAPEEFEEYKIPQEPILVDEAVETVRDYIKENKFSVVSFLKAFPRKKRVDIVDILRGALPMPIDFREISLIGKTLNMPQEEVYSIWEMRMRQVLESAGMNIYSNSQIVNSMFECAKKEILKLNK
ncbi:helix-turn-helix transcriptional regulator [bacterium]|nr:helix-turn-helix transcriptional regulator [bacterium]